MRSGKYGLNSFKRMELIRRTAPTRLIEPRAMDGFDVLATALTRNKAQPFPQNGGQRYKVWSQWNPTKDGGGPHSGMR